MVLKASPRRRLVVRAEKKSGRPPPPCQNQGEIARDEWRKRRRTGGEQQVKKRLPHHLLAARSAVTSAERCGPPSSERRRRSIQKGSGSRDPSKGQVRGGRGRCLEEGERLERRRSCCERDARKSDGKSCEREMRERAAALLLRRGRRGVEGGCYLGLGCLRRGKIWASSWARPVSFSFSFPFFPFSFSSFFYPSCCFWKVIRRRLASPRRRLDTRRRLDFA